MKKGIDGERDLTGLVGTIKLDLALAGPIANKCQAVTHSVFFLLGRQIRGHNQDV